jgi:hypothetical protein
MFPEHVSFSSWQLYRNVCPWRWKLDYVDRLRLNKISGIYLDFGTSIHETIEKRKDRKSPISLKEALIHFEKKFSDLYGKNSQDYSEREKKQSRDKFIESGKTIIEHLENLGELNDSEVVFCEHPLYVPIDRSDDLKVNFKGAIDMVIKTKDARGNSILYVIDFKTCSWGWDKEKKQDKEKQHQLFLYKHFLSKEFGLDPKNVRCAFVLLKRTPRKGDSAVEFFPVSAGPVSVQRSLDALNSDLTEMKRQVDTDTVKKNREACIDPFGGMCPYYNSPHCLSEKKP